MPRCDDVTCDDRADRVVRFRAGGDTRNYCLSCYAEVSSRTHFDTTIIRKL